MSTAVQERPSNTASVPALQPPRLPYHPLVEERFGVDKASWKALVEAIFPNATSTESVILALSYCRARKLDPFKRNVHIVPIWDRNRNCMVDTIWPGIGELRTTAFRTGSYAGREASVYGPDLEMKLGNVDMKFPEWAQVTVYRMVGSQRVAFVGPRVYWLETYSTRKRDTDAPNDMWENRPRGQIDKCAEAAALRAAFPEEIGNEITNDEARTSRTVVSEVVGAGPRSTDQVLDRVKQLAGKADADDPVEGAENGQANGAALGTSQDTAQETVKGEDSQDAGPTQEAEQKAPTEDEAKPAGEDLGDFANFRGWCKAAADEAGIAEDGFTTAFNNQVVGTGIKSPRRKEYEPARAKVLAAWRNGQVEVPSGKIL